MKGKIIDSSELTDSKEYYGRRPNPATKVTALVIVLLVIAAIIFCSIKKIEITSTATGVVRPLEDISTVSSLSNGVVQEVSYKNGKEVKKGDILLLLQSSGTDIDEGAYKTSRKKIVKQLKQWELFLDGVEKEHNPFSDDPKGESYSFYLQYLDYQLTLEDALKQSEYEIRQADSNLSLAKKQLSDIDHQLDGAMHFLTSLKTEEDLVKAYPEYESLYQEYLSALKLKWRPSERKAFQEQTIASAEETIRNLESEKLPAKNAVKSYEDTVEALSNKSIKKVSKTKEKEAIVAQIDQLKSQLDELDEQQKQVDLQMKPIEIKAPESGIINSIGLLTKGDVVSAGMQICTILPNENGDYKVQLYLHNEDVSSVSAGDTVRYNLSSLPSSYYGNIVGKITNIGKDTIIQEGEYTGYYLVEASIEKNEYVDKDGNAKKLQAGMQLEAKIVTEEKTIMHYLFEKIY